VRKVYRTVKPPAVRGTVTISEARAAVEAVLNGNGRPAVVPRRPIRSKRATRKHRLAASVQ
jgi:hypothetical protein